MQIKLDKPILVKETVVTESETSILEVERITLNFEQQIVELKIYGIDQPIVRGAKHFEQALKNVDTLCLDCLKPMIDSREV